MDGQKGNKGYINGSLDKGLVSLYALNHLSSLDSDQSHYFHEHRMQIVNSCLLGAFMGQHVNEAL